MVRDGDVYVLNGRKWFAPTGMHRNCKVLIEGSKSLVRSSKGPARSCLNNWDAPTASEIAAYQVRAVCTHSTRSTVAGHPSRVCPPIAEHIPHTLTGGSDVTGNGLVLGV